MADAEAEYRLVQLAKQIILAKRASTSLSLEVKGAFTDSAVGNLTTLGVRVEEATKLGAQAQEQWLKVSGDFITTRNWLEGKIRPDYARVLCEILVSTSSEGETVSSDLDFHKALIEVGSSANYMSWAFEELSAECSNAETPEDAIGEMFAQLSSFAKDNADNTAAFLSAYGQMMDESSFLQGGLYRYTHDKLVVTSTKPEILRRDEIYFVGVSRFDIYYEAVEQVAREAHIRLPGTDDRELQTFGGEFTK